MQITHEEARRLIHFHADDALNLQEKNLLSTHLKACFDCRVYAEEIKEVESKLIPVMKREWNLHPIPLFVSGLKAKREKKILTGNILAIRTAIISFLFVAFAFSMWQFTNSGQQMPGISPVMVSSIPTPSIESTSTTISFEDCDTIHYTVQANDTLASIADQFSVSKNDIISINQLKTEAVYTGMTLWVPACRLTPTVVAKPTLSLTSIGPLINSETSSPEPNRY